MSIRGTAQFECLGDKVRDERMKGSGPIQRQDSGYIRQTVLKVKLGARRKRRRPQTGFMDVVKDAMQRITVTKEDVRERVRRSQMTCW